MLEKQGASLLLPSSSSSSIIQILHSFLFFNVYFYLVLHLSCILLFYCFIFLTIPRWMHFFLAGGLSETTSLSHKGRGKVSLNTTLPTSHLWALDVVVQTFHQAFKLTISSTCFSFWKRSMIALKYALKRLIMMIRCNNFQSLHTNWNLRNLSGKQLNLRKCRHLSAQIVCTFFCLFLYRNSGISVLNS